MRCLIVDDNPDFLGSASRLLESQGLDVVGCAGTGEEAVRLTLELRPDVALVDVELGGESGFDVTRSILSAAGATRVVLISTHDANELSELIRSSPARGFIPKSRLGAATIRGLVDRGSQ